MAESRALVLNETFNPQNRLVWRQWLSQNHASSRGIWLIIQKKKSPNTGISLEEAVEEALCFGWIDGRLRSLDGTSFKLLLTPRKPQSLWSKINKHRVEKLIEEGLMTAAGLQKIQAAKEDGSWNKIDPVDDLILPEDFKRALNSNEVAKRNFEAFSPSVKKQLLWLIESAKKAETRSKRVKQAVAIAEANQRNPFS
jgi:uncharacterized protein YdeI (YjbR/CyaY-like superfamily)